MNKLRQKNRLTSTHLLCSFMIKVLGVCLLFYASPSLVLAQSWGAPPPPLDMGQANNPSEVQRQDYYKTLIKQYQELSTTKTITEIMSEPKLRRETGFMFIALARQYEKFQQPALALEYYQRAVQWYPEHYLVYSILGSAYLARNRYEDALKELVRARDLVLKEDAASYEVSIFEQLGSTLRMLGRFKEAEAARLHAIEVINAEYHAPQRFLSTSYDGLAMVYLAWGKLDQAKKALGLAVRYKDQADPSYSHEGHLHYTLGVWHGRQQDWKQARSELEQALPFYKPQPSMTLKPMWVHTHIALAQVYRALDLSSNRKTSIQAIIKVCKRTDGVGITKECKQAKRNRLF